MQRRRLGARRSDLTEATVFGAFDTSGELCALASYQVWGNQLAHLSIVTRPDQRGSGRGTAAVACAAQHALGRSLIPQYRTLVANAPSMAIARRLGFEEYGFSVYVRLASSSGE